MPKDDWRHRAACGSTDDPELFFPIGQTGPSLDQIEAAKQICHRCEVRVECLDYSFRSGSSHGIWGGMTEDERSKFRRQRARAQARASATRG